MTFRIHALKVAFLLVVLIVVSLVAHAPNVEWFGIRPNIVLALLVAAIFFIEDFFIYLGFVLIASALVGPAPGFSFEELAFVLVLIATFFLRGRLPFHPASSVLMLAAAATLVFYLAVDTAFVAADFIAVFFEMVYNALGAALFYVVLRRIPWYAR